jgi:hypothetical protein
LAKKTRTPAPPKRPVQAPKVRTGKERTAAERRRPSLALVGLAASGVVALVAVLGLLAFVGGGSDSVTAEDFLPCRFTEHPTSPGGQHVDENKKVKYGTSPPTSGEHFGATAIWNFYDEPVSKLRVVHNLEHGAIAVWYGPQVPEAQQEQLRDFYNEDPNAVIVSQLPGLGRRVAATAWVASTGEPTTNGGKILRCQQVELEPLRKFRDAFRGQGPERIDVDRLVPGGQ